MGARRLAHLIVIGVTLSLQVGVADAADSAKPSLKLRASPTVLFTQGQVTLTGELRGVDEDDAAFYCPSVEWDWGDGTRSVTSSDCQPFEPGVSEIRTRYVRQHRYPYPGQFRVVLRLRQGTSTLVSASTTVTVRPGAEP